MGPHQNLGLIQLLPGEEVLVHEILFCQSLRSAGLPPYILESNPGVLNNSGLGDVPYLSGVGEPPIVNCQHLVASLQEFLIQLHPELIEVLINARSFHTLIKVKLSTKCETSKRMLMDVNPSIIPVRIATCLSYPVKVEDERFLWIHVDWSHVPGAYDDVMC